MAIHPCGEDSSIDCLCELFIIRNSYSVHFLLRLLDQSPQTVPAKTDVCISKFTIAPVASSPEPAWKPRRHVMLLETDLEGLGNRRKRLFNGIYVGDDGLKLAEDSE